MNRNQWFVLSFFMLFLLFYLPFIILSGSIHHDSVYFGVRDGILSTIMWLAYPLMILFFVLALFEKRKGK